MNENILEIIHQMRALVGIFVHFELVHLNKLLKLKTNDSHVTRTTRKKKASILQILK